MDVKRIRARIAKLATHAPRAKPEELLALQVAALRFALVLENFAARQPAYVEIPASILAQTEAELLTTWDAEGALPVVLDARFLTTWMRRLGHHLALPGWRMHLFDPIFREAIARQRGWARAPFDIRSTMPALPRKADRAVVFDEVASSLLAFEAGGSSPPDWMPTKLVDAARELAVVHDQVLSMNSEQRIRRMRELMIKGGARPRVPAEEAQATIDLINET